MVPSGPIRPRLGGEGGGQRSTCLENDNDNDRIGMGMGTGMSFGVWSPVLRRAARLLRGRVLSAFGFGSFSRIVHGRRTACDSANQRTLVRKLALGTGTGVGIGTADSPTPDSSRLRGIIDLVSLSGDRPNPSIPNSQQPAVIAARAIAMQRARRVLGSEA